MEKTWSSFMFSSLSCKMDRRSSSETASSASMENIRSQVASRLAKFFCSEYPGHSLATNLTSCDLQISSVRSVELESTTMISSAMPCNDCRHRSMFLSSLKVIMTADKEFMFPKFSQR